MIEIKDSVLSYLLNHLLNTESPSSEEAKIRLTSALREVLTREPYSTDDNKSAAERLAISDFNVGSDTYLGPVVLPSSAPISSLIWALEDDETIPERVHKSWPELSLLEWKAALRFVVRLLSAVEV